MICAGSTPDQRNAKSPSVSGTDKPPIPKVHATKKPLTPKPDLPKKPVDKLTKSAKVNYIKKLWKYRFVLYVVIAAGDILNSEKN